MSAPRNHGKDAINPKNDYITQCKLCPYAIFKHHKKVWFCHSVVGLVHKECADAFQSDISNLVSTNTK